MYRIREVAEILSVHEKTVRRFMKEGRIKGIRAGGLWRISEDEIERVLGLRENQRSTTEKEIQKV